MARFEVLRMLVSEAAGEQRAALEKAVAQLGSVVANRFTDGAAIAQAARGVAQQADALTSRFSQQDFDQATARRIVKALAADIGRVANSGVNSAEQATMALDALVAAYAGNQPGFQAAIGKLYDYLEHPSTYQPGDFAAQFRRVAATVD